MSTPSSSSTTLRPTGAPRRCRFGLRAFVRGERGTSAVEFAALAVPFLGIICVTFETSIDYWAQLTLDAALQDASRLIYTGQFQGSNAGSAKTETQLLDALRTKLCTTSDGKSRLTMFDCGKVRLSVTSASTFSNSSASNPTTTDPKTNTTTWNANFNKYTCAGPSTIVRVQAAVDFPVVFNLIKLGGVRIAGNRRVLQAANVFRVEPYQNTGACS